MFKNIIHIILPIINSYATYMSSFVFLQIILFKLNNLFNFGINIIILFIINIFIVLFFIDFLRNLGNKILKNPFFIVGLYIFMRTKDNVLKVSKKLTYEGFLSYYNLFICIYSFLFSYVIGYTIIFYITVDTMLIIFTLLSMTFSIFNKIDNLVINEIKKNPKVLINNKLNFRVVKNVLNINRFSSFDSGEFPNIQRRYVWSSFTKIAAEKISQKAAEAGAKAGAEALAKGASSETVIRTASEISSKVALESVALETTKNMGKEGTKLVVPILTALAGAGALMYQADRATEAKMDENSIKRNAQSIDEMKYQHGLEVQAKTSTNKEMKELFQKQYDESKNRKIDAPSVYENQSFDDIFNLF